VRYAKLCSVLLQSVIRGESAIEAIREALASVDPEARKRLEKAITLLGLATPFKPSRTWGKLVMSSRRFRPFFTCSRTPNLSAKP
jgi:hypothetical protein